MLQNKTQIINLNKKLVLFVYIYLTVTRYGAYRMLQTSFSHEKTYNTMKSKNTDNYDKKIKQFSGNEEEEEMVLQVFSNTSTIGEIVGGNVEIKEKSKLRHRARGYKTLHFGWNTTVSGEECLKTTLQHFDEGFQHKMYKTTLYP